MSQNGTKVEEAPKVDAKVETADDGHLVVMLTPQSYSAIKEVVERATDRGLESSFDHWLNDAVKTGTQARLRTWNDRDVVSLYKQAANGNSQAKAKLAKLLKMNLSQ
jgi:hypothetical protein